LVRSDCAGCLVSFGLTQRRKGAETQRIHKEWDDGKFKFLSANDIADIKKIIDLLK